MVPIDRLKLLQSIASRCIVPAVLLMILPEFFYAAQERSTDTETPCYKEVSFNTDLSSAGGKPAFFRHIWGASDKYPYYRYLGAGYIGVIGNAYEDSYDGTKKWSSRKGNKYHSIISLRYKGTVGDGVSINLDNHDLMAFFFTPREPEKKNFWVMSPIPVVRANELGKISAITTVEDSIEYINGSGYAFVYEARKNRARSQSRRLGHHMDGAFYFRTLHSQESRIQVAGKSHTQTRKCRFEYYPLAATNHDRFKLFIEAELQRWVDEPHRNSFVKFGSMPVGNKGDFALTTELGQLKIEFPRSVDHDSVNFTRTSRCTDRYGFQRDGVLPYFRGAVKIGGQSFLLPTRRTGCGYNVGEAKGRLNNHLARQEFATIEGETTVGGVAFIKNGGVYDVYVTRSLAGR